MFMQKLVEGIDSLLPTAIVAFIFGVIKAALAPAPKSFRQAILTVFIAVPVGTLAGLLGRELGLQPYAAMTICSVFSLLSHDVVKFFLNNDQFFGKLLRRGLTNLVDSKTKFNNDESI